ncbi:uncharacterized protein [Cicer arietinum]|uniref:Uncharacterized protein LOC101493806 n=1 Tax=Cicer arietinum TaxID=3827 RepID=A0A1S2Z1A8_CICAR|nr:uncharacterized protein LOC101493806 [Cicer arietinum]
MMQDRRNKVLMEQLKQSLLLRLQALNPSSHSIIKSPHVSSFIDNHLPQVFKSFHTPTHPPYSAMIKRAVRELNEEDGSTDEEISEFIRREYEKDLPFAHSTILKVHLMKLCMNRDLECTKNGRYVLVDCQSEVVVTMLESDKEDNQKDDRDNDWRRFY